MKKIIYRSTVLITLMFVLIVSYLSIIGIETKIFNNQIADEIKKIDKNLDIELKKIKIVLNPINFRIDAKTIGPKLKIKEKNIEIEKIKTQISLGTIIDKKFSLSNLEISTKSIQINELISIIRIIKKSPELFILEKLLKKGYLIADLNFEFDENGQLKENYEVSGIVEDTELRLINDFIISKLKFSFNLTNKNYSFKNLKFSLNNIPLSSEKIYVKNKNDYFLIEGDLNNNDVKLNNKAVNLFFQFFEKKPDIKRINFNSKNNFSFKTNGKFRINDLKIFSEINLDELVIKNDLISKKFLPNIKEEIIFSDHKIEINYMPNKFILKSFGEIILQDQIDKISFEINRNKKLYKVKSLYTIHKNPLIIDFLNYEKNKSLDTLISLEGTFQPNKKTNFDSFSLVEGKSKMQLENLILNKDYKIQSLRKIYLDFKDRDNQNNKLLINRIDNDYIIKGPLFNANNLIKNLIENDNDKKLNIFESDFGISLEIDQVLLDNEHKVKKLRGDLYLKNNEINNAILNASFSNNKFMKFTINSNQDGKVTTLFLDKAEPIVKRYKFIKGYEEGSLDFYSLKKEKITKSKLKVYDFKLKELPALTKLLTLASLQGIADILTGEGIRFNEFEMNFENKDNLMTINEIYAIGPAISILMDGYVEKDKIISLRGTLVPATTLNKVIGSIPFLGKILVGSKSGEGVFGVSFKIKGPPKNLETTVNPIKTLTPRFITRTLEKIKKN